MTYCSEAFLGNIRVLRSIISMLDICQKIEYFVIFRKDIQYRKYRAVSAGVCIGLNVLTVSSSGYSVSKRRSPG